MKNYDGNGDIKCCGNCRHDEEEKKQQIMKIYLMEHKKMSKNETV